MAGYVILQVGILKIVLCYKVAWIFLHLPFQLGIAMRNFASYFYKKENKWPIFTR